ncbi:MAG: DUF4912 domain-containing protein [Treponema sp.]|nr:DUF4912 domain-containing protein [Treponema sp.]
MEAKKLSRSYLETLSSADLLTLADDYDIDVPDDLNRRFLIGELLEVAQESELETREGIDIITDAVLPITTKLPETYNETQINVLLCNPSWAFVFWDMKESDIRRLKENGASLLLRVSFFSDEDAVVPEETFDVQISFSDRAQYVLLRPGKKYVRIDFVAVVAGKADDTLAKSRKVKFSEGSEFLNALPGRDIPATQLQELSSLKELLRLQYENYRQAFFD